MAGFAECRRYEPSLEDLLDDEVMETVLRSAGCNPQGLRDMMVETARRIDNRVARAERRRRVGTIPGAGLSLGDAEERIEGGEQPVGLVDRGAHRLPARQRIVGT